MAMSGEREQRAELDLAAPARPGRLYFPDEAEVPETKRHLELRTLVYQFLKLAFADRAAIGCDQFVYWDPTDPSACLAPDAFVRLGQPDHLFRSWKVWVYGAPQVAVEIISDADERDRDWEAKLAKYRRLGVTELVRFDSESSDRPLRVWDISAGDLRERDLGARMSAQSYCLPGFWLATEHPETGLALRLSHDEHGTRLFPTLAEQEGTARITAETARVTAETARVAAEQRVRELEAELSRKP
jgi:hypothetical protein